MVIGHDHAPHVFRIKLGAQSGRPDEVAERYGKLTPLAARPRVSRCLSRDKRTRLKRALMEGAPKDPSLSVTMSVAAKPRLLSNFLNG
jgi:hypothetical protein